MLEQPYEYSAHALVEPDWRRLPGFADVTDEQWRSAQWQRVNCVKNLRQLRGVYGDLLDESFYADVEADQAGRATMSLLLPPQMLNTMVPGATCRRRPRCWPTRCAGTCCPVASDRLPGAAASHPYAARDSLHEHEMWAVEGLTHRYPTKVLAELLSTCPQYCGHCTRMDLVGNSTPAVPKLKFALKPVDRQAEMLAYLRATPGVRDVVVSGGDVANLPFKNLEAFVAGLLEIESVRDIRLATKALMGMPQHWLQDDVVEGMGRLADHRPGPRRLPRRPHARERRAVGDAAGGRGRPGDAGGRRARRPQPGRPAARGERLGGPAARPLLRAARRCRHHALLLLHVRHDPERRALAGLAGPGADAAARHHGLPARASRRRGSSATSRTSASAGCTRSPSTTASAASATGRRTTAPASSAPTRPRSTGATRTTTRSRRCRQPVRRGGRSGSTTRWQPS